MLASSPAPPAASSRPGRMLIAGCLPEDSCRQHAQLAHEQAAGAGQAACVRGEVRHEGFLRGLWSLPEPGLYFIAAQAATKYSNLCASACSQPCRQAAPTSQGTASYIGRCSRRAGCSAERRIQAPDKEHSSPAHRSLACPRKRGGKIDRHRPWVCACSLPGADLSSLPQLAHSQLAASCSASGWPLLTRVSV